MDVKCTAWMFRDSYNLGIFKLQVNQYVPAKRTPTETSFLNIITSCITE